jgi:hypothetical protein
MQISVELVDWDWLRSFADPPAMIDALMDADKRNTAPYHEICYDFIPDWIEPARDDLQLGPDSDGCFFASLSPESVRAAARAVRGLDLNAVAGKLDPTRQPLFHTILRQWATAIYRAEERGAGMIGHCG